MKFQVTYERELARFPTHVARRLFPYGALKRAVRDDGLVQPWEEWRNLLLHHLAQSQRVLLPRVRWLAPAMSDEDTLKACVLVSTAFRKMCKKVQRRLRMPAVSLHAKACNTHEILGGARLKALAHPKSAECPVCLEESARDFVILRCGHTVCAECAASIWANPDDPTATALASLNKPCPVCRTRLAAHPWFALRVKPTPPRRRLVERVLSAAGVRCCCAPHAAEPPVTVR